MSYDSVPPPYRPVDGVVPPTVYSGLRGRPWKEAPGVVKGWAYPLTWLVLLISGIGVLAGLLNTGVEVPIRVMMVGFYGALFVLHVWLNRALKRGTQAAWTVQFVLSVIGLLGIPLGTLIHGYILSQWFKPETKSWFGA